MRRSNDRYAIAEVEFFGLQECPVGAVPDEVKGSGTRPAHAARMHGMGSHRAQAKHTVLVLGGYGFFGQRICESLAANRHLEVRIGGRDLARASELANYLRLPASSAIRIDAANPGLAQDLGACQVDTVIHLAGPFQAQEYTVARAAIAAGINYIDIADGRDFVGGITSLNDMAERAGVIVLSGASSVPALSSAVINRLAPEFGSIETIRIGIASGGRAPGLATMRGVFSYCGKAFPRWENGRWIDTHGWLDLKRYPFPPPVGSRWLGSCNVPDLELLPTHFPSAKTVTFHAGFASGPGHLAVWALAHLVKAGALKDMAPLAAPMRRVAGWIEPIVSDAGGMFVEIAGAGSDGQPLKRVWTLIAEQNHGPYIPCGAAIALANKLASGNELSAGAYPCVGVLSVDEYLAPLQGFCIREIS